MTYAITGVTGQVGGSVARALLASKQPVRAVVRDPKKGIPWAERGCEIATADIGDPAALGHAFQGAEGVFILPPPNFDPSPDFAEARALAASLRETLLAARPGRIVYLSTIGAQATHENLLTQHTIVEQALEELPVPTIFLRPAWFMENCSWDVATARISGVIPSYLQPLDKPVPMVATEDIGRVAAELLQESWTGHRIVELEGPGRVTPNDIAATFSKLLGAPVRMEVVPRASWQELFEAQGTRNPMPRIRMLDGFNEGWIEFESGPMGSRKGGIPLEIVLRELVEKDRG